MRSLRLLAPLVAAVLAGPVFAQGIFQDSFEPGCPSSWSLAAGWSCVDGDAPVPGNPTLEEPGSDGCPDGMVAIGGSFCIDRFEASLVDSGTGLPWSSYLRPGPGDNVIARSVRTATPQGYIDQVTAGTACGNAGKRLCTDAEWLRACRGPSGFTYPWGNSAQPGVCNDARAVHPAVEYYGSSDPWVFTHLDQPCLDQLPAGLERTGTRSGCVSAEGPMDMMGNLIEWTADPAGTLRGGFYVDTVINGPGCSYTTTAHDVTHWDYATGFRCCANL